MADEMDSHTHRSSAARTLIGGKAYFSIDLWSLNIFITINDGTCRSIMDIRRRMRKNDENGAEWWMYGGYTRKMCGRQHFRSSFIVPNAGLGWKTENFHLMIVRVDIVSSQVSIM